MPSPEDVCLQSINVTMPMTKPALSRGNLGMLPAGRLAVPALLAAVLLLSGCASYGARRLNTDQVDYARAISLSKKRQTLSNIVCLRYADVPSFLSVTQIIAGYSQTMSVTGGVTPAATPANTTGQLGGTLSFADNPTFTFTPTTGTAFAEGYIRPLAPTLILPLAQSGMPIDVLFRAAVQSIGDLQNSAALAGNGSAGSIGFFQLTHALRRLQIAGVLTVRFVKNKDADHVYLSLPVNGAGLPDQEAKDVAQVRDLLHVTASEFEVVYGTAAGGGASVGMITRSVLGILSEIGAQIDVPEADVRSGATLPSVKNIGVETRPVVIIHSGDHPPSDAYVDVAYDGHHYWIDAGDFDSKYAFSLLEDLIALAEVTDNSKNPIVTIPAG